MIVDIDFVFFHWNEYGSLKNFNKEAHRAKPMFSPEYLFKQCQEHIVKKHAVVVNVSAFTILTRSKYRNYWSFWWCRQAVVN